jgi:hypothetical protein
VEARGAEESGVVIFGPERGSKIQNSALRVDWILECLEGGSVGSVFLGVCHVTGTDQKNKKVNRARL